MDDPSEISLSLSCKLGSIVVHTKQLLSTHSSFIKGTGGESLHSLLGDEEVRQWLTRMEELGMTLKERGKLP